MRYSILFLSFLLLQTQLSVSKTIIVDKSGFGQYTTIQAGIDAASDGDTVLVADGIYVSTGNQNIIFHGKAIVVKSEHGPGNCFVDCQRIAMSIAFVFNVPKDSSCVLEGFTIRNANIGIWAYAGSSPTVRNNVIDSCNVGIWSSSMAAPSITGNTIQYNDNDTSTSTLVKAGCAISLEWSSAKIGQNTIRKNLGIHGGGISCNNSSPLIIGNTIDDNDGGARGGGILIENDSHPIIRNNIVTDNSAYYGGGIYSDSTSSASILNNTILSNNATYGGGLFSDNSSSIVSNNIIAFSKYLPALGRNFYAYNFIRTINYEGATAKSVDYTFAIHNSGQSGYVTMKSKSTGLGIDTTFFMQTEERLLININSLFDTHANLGGLDIAIALGVNTINIEANGPFYGGGSYFLTLTVDSSYHTPASFEFFEIGTNSTISYCDIYGDKEGSYCTERTMFTLGGVVQVNLVGIEGNISADPLCEPPTYQLKENSPCIDAGNPDPSFNEQRPPGMGSARCDMGAYGGPNGIVTSVGSKREYQVKPLRFILYNNYPNPFNPSTTIGYELPVNSFVTLIIYDALGRKVQTLVDQHQNAGNYSITFNANNLPSGIYFCRLQTGIFTETKKFILLR